MDFVIPIFLGYCTYIQTWIFQIAQGWELHTHLDIIIEVPYINNQQRKKLYQRILGFAPYCRTRTCITAEDGMNKQQNVANCTSHHSLHILDVGLLASWAVLCSGPNHWFEEDFTIIFLDMKTQNDKQSRPVSSPTRIVSQDIADCTFFSTIRTSASPLVWRVSHPTCSKL